jgi:hypothetical protein
MFISLMICEAFLLHNLSFDFAFSVSHTTANDSFLQVTEPQKKTVHRNHDNDLKSIVAPRKRRFIEAACGEEIQGNECVVCPSLLEVASRKNTPARFLDNFGVLDLSKVFCCLRRCASLLSGQKFERRKVQNVMHRFDTWVTA